MAPQRISLNIPVHGSHDSQGHLRPAVVQDAIEVIQQGALNFADRRAKNDLSGFYDRSREPREFHTVASPKTAAFFVRDKRKATDPDNDGKER